MSAQPPPSLDDFDLDRLKLHVSQARSHLRAIERLLPGMKPLSEEDRECLPAIVDEEMARALGPVLDVMELVPGSFEVLGLDPFVWGPDLEGFSVALVRRLLQVWLALNPLATELGRFSRLVADYLVWVGAPVRNPAGASAADTAMNLADRNPDVKAALRDSYAYWNRSAPRRMAKRREEERRTKKGRRT